MGEIIHLTVRMFSFLNVVSFVGCVNGDVNLITIIMMIIVVISSMV